MLFDLARKERHDKYFELVKKRSTLFEGRSEYKIVLDRAKIENFEEESGKKVGVVYDNTPFYVVVADLIDAERPYTHARVIYPEKKNGTVIIPVWKKEGEEVLFGVLNEFRHCIGMYSGGEFPRGYLEKGLSLSENAVKELTEELKVEREQIGEIVFLGETRADTGLSSGEASICVVKLSGKRPEANVGHEGIAGVLWMTEGELLRRIKDGEIKDGFTQTAMLMYMLNK